MDADTYSNPAVRDLLEDGLVPLRLPHDTEPLASRYAVSSTPLLILLDRQAQELHRIEGVHPPEEFIPAVLLGLAKVDFFTGKYGAARERLADLLEGYPASRAVPEGLLLQGRSLHRLTGDPAHLRKAFEILSTNHPGSPWTREASGYRLL